MIYNIGQDLGTIEDYKITKTAARIQVSIDGLKPLTKTVVVDFDSGEELVINLDYEDLGYHCSICHAPLMLREHARSLQWGLLATHYRYLR